jgi:hypothetical protein
LGAAGAGAAGNMAGGALGRHMNGQPQTLAAFGQDAGEGAISGAIGGTGSYAVKGALRAVQGGVTKAASARAAREAGDAWQARQLPGHLPADKNSIKCVAPGTPSTAGSSFSNLTHSSQGIKPYSEQRKITAGHKGEIQAHHLIEQRFIAQIGGNVRDWPSVVVTKAEHQAFTNQWLKEIPRGRGTRNATPEEINNAARKIYSGYPEFLDSLGLK